MTHMALQDLFLRHREKATGLWKLGQEPSRTIFFDAGDVVFAQSTYPSDRLTHLLVERGKLTQTQLDYALANLRPGISIGKNLIEMGFITQRDLLDVARAQVERVVSGALATPGEVPTFDARELDANVVRLPFDTPELLLNGLLGLKDREALLELLGPLNQVVVLQGRRLLEMTLPVDLAKLPPLLDGTHTLLELSRESLAEPLRLGTFALFLREMGWARLHEMPPMDRGAIEIALTPEAEVLSLPLPGPDLETVPSLFSTIHAAAKPTTNLEHLSDALDALPEPERSQAGAEFTVETGQAILEPIFELPEHLDIEVPNFDSEPVATIPESAPAVLILPSTLTNPESAEILSAPNFEEEIPRRSKKGWIALVAVILLVAAVFGWKRWRNRSKNPPVVIVPTPAVVLPESKVENPIKPLIEEPPPQVEAKTPPSPQGDPKGPVPPKVIGTSAKDRAEALRQGDIARVLRQGELILANLPKGRWTLRLEIACQVETLKRAVDLFGTPDPDIWVAPLSLRDGRGCYQLFFAHFPDRKSAEAASRKIPAAFRSEGNRPKPFKIEEITVRQ
ncbi:MAG: hypothetical protein Q8O00_06000 [Holophaga sp.]|nr:hypothetical protein [Holophaga sp.]